MNFTNKHKILSLLIRPKVLVVEGWANIEFFTITIFEAAGLDTYVGRDALDDNF